jgi:polar amino acid transport system permease protein
VFFNPQIMADMMPEAITVGVRNTIFYTVGAFTFGFVFALILALMRLSPVGPYRWIATGYIEFFRSIPALITILVVAFGIPIALGARVPGGILGTGSVGLGIVAAAYMAETMRAGIEAVPLGQAEAARSLGMSSGKAMMFIVLPQAFRIIIPPLTNELVLLFKDTALLAVLGTLAGGKEITKFARDLVNQTANTSPLVLGGIAYLVITIPLMRLVAVLERRTAANR